jgi:hypothetical protein
MAKTFGGSFQFDGCLQFKTCEKEYLMQEGKKTTALQSPDRNDYSQVMSSPKSHFMERLSLRAENHRNKDVEFSAVPVHCFDNPDGQRKKRVKIRQMPVSTEPWQVGSAGNFFALIQRSEPSSTSSMNLARESPFGLMDAASAQSLMASRTASRATSPTFDFLSGKLPAFNSAFHDSIWPAEAVPDYGQSLRGEDETTEHHGTSDDYPMHLHAFSRDHSNPVTPSGSVRGGMMGWGGGGTTGIGIAPLISAHGTPEKRKHNKETVYFDEQPSPQGSYSIINSKRIAVRAPSLYNEEEWSPRDEFEEGIQPM